MPGAALGGVSVSEGSYVDNTTIPYKQFWGYSAMPNVQWQTTSSNATYASASNIVTDKGRVLKRTGPTYT